MKLPNPQLAVVDIAKLRDYCLNPQHEEGKHKAKVFAAALGIGRSDVEWLRGRLLDIVSEEAVLMTESQFGRLYFIDALLETLHGSAKIRSGWIVRAGENFPRLTTCFVLKEGGRTE